MKGSFRDRAKKAKANLTACHQESYDKRESKGGGTSSVFDKEILKKLGIEEWNPGKGEHLIDVIPFYAGKQHPDRAEGEMTYLVDYWAHQRIGPMYDFFVCQRNTFNKVDPICAYIQKNRPDKKEWMDIRPVRRCAYLIWVHDDEKERAKGIQVWDIAHWFFEKNVTAIQKDIKTGRPIPWSDFDQGKHVYFKISTSGSFEDSAGKKRDSVEFSGFQLVDRDNPKIPDKILDMSFALDEAMIMHPDEKIVTEAFYGDDSQQKQNEEPDKRGPAKSALERAKERIEKQKESEPETEPEIEPETELETEPEIEPETELETEPEPGTCPHSDIGGEYGVAIEQLAECDNCDLWQNCSEEYDRLKSVKKSPTVKKSESERKPKLVRRG